MDGALIIFLLMGAFGGLLLGMLMGWAMGKKEGAKQAARRQRRLEAVSAASPAPKASASEPTQSPSPPPQPSLGLTLRRAGGNLEVILDGVTYRKYATMPADSRSRLLAYLKLVREWMQGHSVQHVTTAARPVQATLSASSFTEEKPAAEPRTMVDQIDDIVQELLEKSPLSQPVHIVSGLTGGVNIIVGTQRYESLDEIPDKAVQALVRQAVKIWESQQ